MNTNALLNLFETIFNTNQCMDYLKAIYDNDKLFSFDAFERTAHNCVSIMQDIGLEDIEMLPVKADGKTTYGDWVIPQAWNVESAVLKCGDIVLADYNIVPCSLIMYSAATSNAGINAECIIVDTLDNINSSDIKNKIIVTSLPANKIIDIAIEFGAIAIVTDYIPLYKNVRDNLDEMQEISRWDNATFSNSNCRHGLFGFSLSPANGKLLRKLIEEGNTTLYANVKTKSYNGNCYTVSGKIKGEVEDSVCIYGHLYEPGANDNASGCSMILELAHCINNAIEKCLLPTPRLSIYFVMGWECTGSIAWLTAKDRHVVGGIVADMVGTDTIDNTHMCIWHAPMSNISFADYYIEHIIEQYNVKFKWQNKKFSIGTDNIISDPCFDIPSIAMITEPALSYHSSMDSPDRIQKEVISRNGIIIGTYLFGLASMDINDAGILWDSTKDYINNTTFKYKSELFKIARQSIMRFYPSFFPDEINYNDMPLPPDYTNDIGMLTPIRNIAGCLTFASDEKLLNSKWRPAWNDELNIPLFWIDGKRNLWTITVFCAEECNIPIEKQWRELLEYFKFLIENNIISLRNDHFAKLI